ncbi:16S rRNA (adenine(1518)-N(6)/adenine(1519)-N(6))-dimethyltransferase RsmA [Candidatus Solincola tengchongensis]|uniref:16S rRNA (adenine(1518)-N(6)/adenine(1519)-N(6))- dimethyltransferase RsmA n=1 Tax=Candidatus Solincola tengchongensis TaxID=2900693 RepID=UPI00257B6489|nr:16S rRNA (adenine(1518)-N(6)/adenine(1519)-N(6))-dimethyltransferase RsmA [Candidatus Solincola tengchongensis]
MGELTKPSVVAEILERHGIRLSRSLGQHFLVDSNVLNRILEGAELGPGDAVLEIGPGIGTLTEELCERAGRVVAVEVDARLKSVLDEMLGERPNLLTVRGDAMRIDLAGFFSPQERVKVVSNLPYNVATPLLLRIMRELPQARLLVVTVQRELADRYLASPGEPSYGAVSVKVQFLARPRRLAQLAPTVFLPPPRVGSTLLRLERVGPVPGTDYVRSFFLFLDACFSNRRKMLVNALGGGRRPYRSREEVASALRELGLPPTARAEELSLRELLGLHRLLGP